MSDFTDKIGKLESVKENETKGEVTNQAMQEAEQVGALKKLNDYFDD